MTKQEPIKECETCGAPTHDSNDNTFILCDKCRNHLDIFGYVMNESRRS